MVDGTYGRLSAHKERVKMLYSKKEKYRKPDFSGMYADEGGIAQADIQPEVLESLKEEIRHKGRLEKRKQRIIIAVSIFGALLFGYWLFTSI